jgi:hypothetical protein
LEVEVAQRFNGYNGTNSRVGHVGLAQSAASVSSRISGSHCNNAHGVFLSRAQAAHAFDVVLDTDDGRFHRSDHVFAFQRGQRFHGCHASYANDGALAETILKHACLFSQNLLAGRSLFTDDTHLLFLRGDLLRAQRFNCVVPRSHYRPSALSQVFHTIAENNCNVTQ